MVLEVYLDPCTVNSRKVLAGLDLLGTSYKFNFIDYFAGGHKADHYVQNINPHATVPAMTDGDLKLSESNSILQYAADVDGKEHPAYPSDLKKRADINRWLLFEASSWFPSCYIYLVEYVVKPLLQAQPDQSIIDGEAPKWNKKAAILDEQLGKTKFIAGNEVSIADIAIAAPMHVHKAQRLPLDKYPNLARWISDIEALPCWQKTQDAVDKALQVGKYGASTNGTAAHSNGVSNGTAANGLPKEVSATFNYSKDRGEELTELYFYDDPKAAHIHEPGGSEHEMTVTNGWHRADTFSEDKEGFAVKDFKSQYAGAWDDDSAVREQFYPEVVEFLKKTIGAKRVLVFDHTIRTKANAQKKLTQETGTSQRAPVRLVHCDYTAESGPVRVKQLLPDEADDLLSRRVAFVNVWKPLRKVEENPLAMCDVTSSPKDDFFKLYLRYRDRTGENYVMRHNPDHKWWYFPNMTQEQVILLKTYDSDTSKAQFVGHSAFDDPTAKADAPFRESVEIRTIAFY